VLFDPLAPPSAPEVLLPHAPADATATHFKKNRSI